MTLVLGIDLGYSGARAAVADKALRIVATGERVAVETRTAFGRAEQDPVAWTHAIERTVRSAVANVDASRIEAIAVAGLGPAPVLVDAALEPLVPALLFSLDTRAELQRRRLAAELDLRDDQLNHDHAIPKLMWWEEEEPEACANAACALDASGFVVAWLTGKPVMDTITVLDYTLDGASCPFPLPAPADPLAKAGGLLPARASRLGLPAGVPVLVGTYDAYADTASAGVASVGDACIVFGSTLIIAVAVDRLPEDLHGLVSTPHLGGGVLVGGWTTTGGAALPWIKGLLGHGPEAGPLDELARDLAPGDGGIVFLPYLSGERSPVHDAAARGALVGLTSETTSVQIYRAVVDGLALSVRDHSERLELIGAAPTTWRATGGGIHSRTLLQATADATGASLEVVAGAAAPIGPCAVALMSLGIDPPVRVEETVAPSAEAGERFDELYDVYRALYPALADELHVLTELNRRAGGGSGNDARRTTARRA